MVIRYDVAIFLRMILYNHVRVLFAVLQLCIMISASCVDFTELQVYHMQCKDMQVRACSYHLQCRH